MTWKMKSLLAALATSALVAVAPAHAQQSKPGAADPRPANPEANLPSDTGSQSTLPSGAVTGAGHPQGTTPQPDYGKPGGLEERARREAAEGRDGQRPSPRSDRSKDTKSPGR